MLETNDNLTFEVPIVEFYALILQHLGKAHAIDKPLWEKKLKQYENTSLVGDRDKAIQELAGMLQSGGACNLEEIGLVQTKNA